MLAAEPERFIKSAIAQVVGTVARHELPGHRWPALLDFLSQTMMAENLQDKEVGRATGADVNQRPTGVFTGPASSPCYLPTIGSIGDPKMALYSPGHELSEYVAEF